MNVGFQPNAFQLTAFATDAYVFPKPAFIARAPNIPLYTVKEPDHTIMIAKAKEVLMTARPR